MRTTIDLPDDLFREVKVKAAHEGIRLKELLRRYVESGLREDHRQPDAASRRRSELPVARPATGRPLPALSHAELAEILDQEEAQDALGTAHGSPGR